MSLGYIFTYFTLYFVQKTVEDAGCPVSGPPSVVIKDFYDLLALLSQPVYPTTLLQLRLQVTHSLCE